MQKLQTRVKNYIGHSNTFSCKQKNFRDREVEEKFVGGRQENQEKKLHQNRIALQSRTKQKVKNS